MAKSSTRGSLSGIWEGIDAEDENDRDSDYSRAEDKSDRDSGYAEDHNPVNPIFPAFSNPYNRSVLVPLNHVFRILITRDAWSYFSTILKIALYPE